MASKTMHALRVTKDGGDPKLEATTVPVPAVSGANILVHIHASYINPSDLMNTLGGFPYTTFPRTPGRDFAGTVVAVGPDGGQQLVGKRVFGTSGKAFSFTEDGAHAEYALVTAGAEALIEIPDNLSFVQAATIGVPFSTASLVVDRATTTPTDVVLVLGATGSVGGAAVQIATALGCKVLKAGRRGAGIDVNTADDPKLAAAKTLTGGKGPDVIIDTVGDPVLMRAALEVLGPRGRYSYISAPKAGSTDVSFDMKQLYRLEQTIVGTNSLNYSASETAASLRKLAPEFASGKLKPDDEARFTLVPLGPEAVEAYGKMKAKQPGRFVITTGSSDSNAVTQ